MKRGKKQHSWYFYCGALAVVLLLSAGALFLRHAAGNLPASPPSSQPAAPAASAPDSWELLLVNSEHPLPAGHTFTQSKLKNGLAVDSRIYDSLTRMLADCRAAGLSPVVCSAYRSVERQSELFAQKVQELETQGLSREASRREAARWVALPGTSEHNTGLAVDIVSRSYQTLDEAQADTPEQQWLMAHCAEYGFILRYPTDKAAITGIAFEPWHYRYVGREAAHTIMSQGLTLEEYLGSAA